MRATVTGQMPSSRSVVVQQLRAGRLEPFHPVGVKPGGMQEHEVLWVLGVGQLLVDLVEEVDLQLKFRPLLSLRREGRPQVVVTAIETVAWLPLNGESLDRKSVV